MPISPDDFDNEPPSPPGPMTSPTSGSPVPIYAPPRQPVRMQPGRPAWVNLLILVIIVVLVFALVSGGRQRDVAVTDTAVTDAGVVAVSTDTMMVSTRLARGVRRYSPAPFRLTTWMFGPGGGRGVDMVFSTVTVRDDETVVTLEVWADHHDLLLFRPPKASEPHTGAEDFEELHLIVDGETKLYSTTGFEGGRQSRFNDRVRRIDIYPGERVALTARFPPLPDGATTLKFVSPRLNGWQVEWWWQDVPLGAVYVLPED